MTDTQENVMKWLVTTRAENHTDRFIQHCTAAAKFARQGRLAQAAWMLSAADVDMQKLSGDARIRAIYLLGAMEKAVGIHDEIAAARCP